MYWYNYPWGEIWSPQRDKYQVHTHTYTHIYIYVEPPTLNSDFPFIFSKNFVQKWSWYPKKHGLHWIQRATANSDLWLICVSLACIILLTTKQERVKTERKMNSWYRPSPVFLCLWTRTSLSILFSWEKCERLQPCPVSVYWTGHISAQHIHHYFPLWYCVCLRHLPGLKIGQKRQVSTIMSLAGQKTQATQIQLCSSQKHKNTMNMCTTKHHTFKITLQFHS